MPHNGSKKAFMFSTRLLAAASLSLLICGCAAKNLERRSAIVPSSSIPKAQSYGLVDVRAAIPDISVDLRYATKHNVTGHPIYPKDMPCLLRASTVERLKKLRRLFEPRATACGFGMLGVHLKLSSFCISTAAARACFWTHALAGHATVAAFLWMRLWWMRMDVNSACRPTLMKISLRLLAMSCREIHMSDKIF